jgi:RNA polymerase sigma-70 factor, ECF subfamily
VLVDEANWIVQSQHGDANAFTHLVELYQVKVFNMCYRMMGDPAEAEDAAQETFLRAYRSIRKYDPGKKFSSWLFSIATHHCIDLIRQRHLTVLPVDGLIDQEIPDKTQGPEATVCQYEEQRLVRALLSPLGATDRAAVIFYYWYDYSYEEIARELGLSISAVKSRLHRARRDMAKLWLEHTPHQPAPQRRLYESSAV